MPASAVLQPVLSTPQRTPEVPLNPLLGRIQSVTQRLQQTKREAPHLVENAPVAKEARKLIKKAIAKSIRDPLVEKCEREFLAFKLGVPSDVFDEKINPGFEKFVKESRLERYLIQFQDTLSVAPTKEILIRSQGVLHPWSAVKEVAIAKQPHFASGLPKLYNPPYKYGQLGIQNSHFYDWNELKPFKREENPSWGNRYVLEICCLCIGKLRIFGDHTWIRLKTPEGDVYSVGIYREDNDVSSGFAVKRARMQSPDISEFWPEKIHTLPFEITKEAFESIKANIEERHRKNDLDFHVLHNNCTKQAMQWAKMGGIHLSAKTSFVYNFIPGSLQKLASKVQTRLPLIVQKVAERVWAVFHYCLCVLFNIAQAVLGGTKVSATFSAEHRKALAPRIASIWDFFRPSKIEVDSPYVLSHVLIQQVAQARETEAKKLGLPADQAQFFIPDAFRIKEAG